MDDLLLLALRAIAAVPRPKGASPAVPNRRLRHDANDMMIDGKRIIATGRLVFKPVGQREDSTETGVSKAYGEAP